MTSPHSEGPRGNDDQILNDAAGTGLTIIKAIFTEMAALFPDKVMHVGCDETTVTPNCTLSMTTSFEEEILKHVASLGKEPMAWEEALSTGAAFVAPAMTLQLWTPRKDVSWTNATNLGFNVLRSAGRNPSLATKNLLEVTDGCGSPLLLLTCALLVTSSHSEGLQHLLP